MRIFLVCCFVGNSMGLKVLKMKYKLLRNKTCDYIVHKLSQTGSSTFTMDEVSNALKPVRTSKVYGPDDVAPTMLKNL